MNDERQRPENFGAGPQPYSDEFAGGAAVAEARVDVMHGVYAHSLPLVGMTVGQARGELAERLNIDPEAIAVVNGTQVADETILLEGSVLNFVKHAGEKGYRRLSKGRP